MRGFRAVRSRVERRGMARGNGVGLLSAAAIVLAAFGSGLGDDDGLGARHVAGAGNQAEAPPAALALAAGRARARDAGPAYRIGPDGRGANAPHGLDLSFTGEGVRVAGAGTRLSLRL